MATITLIGLGPGDPDMLTRAACNRLGQALQVFTPTPGHPALAHLPQHRISLLPSHDLPAAASFLQERTTTTVDETVSCALPGHPCDHPLTSLLRHRSLSLEIVAGLSVFECFRTALATSGHAMTTDIQTIEATALLPAPLDGPGAERVTRREDRAWCEIQEVGEYAPPLTPFPLTSTRPTLIVLPTAGGREQELSCSRMLSTIREALLLRYPPTHPLRIVQLDATGTVQHTETITLATLSDPAHAAEREAGSLLPHTAIFLEPLEPRADRRSFEGLQWVVSRLLGPNGCPWDRKQTFQSLRAGLLEETYEVLEALDLRDMAMLAEELGDVLLQVVLHSEMGRQARLFCIEDVLEHLTSKLIRRHPHVFATLAVEGSDEVLANWEHIKANELQEKGRSRASILDGIPAGLPALATAQKIVSRAARASFDWGSIREVWAKLDEELRELAEAWQEYEQDNTDARHAHVAEELGDVLFILVVLARWFGVEAEPALREANNKFRFRFTYIEQVAREQGRSISEMSLEESLALWREAKQMQRQP